MTQHSEFLISSLQHLAWLAPSADRALTKLLQAMGMRPARAYFFRPPTFLDRLRGLTRLASALSALQLQAEQYYSRPLSLSAHRRPQHTQLDTHSTQHTCRAHPAPVSARLSDIQNSQERFVCCSSLCRPQGEEPACLSWQRGDVGWRQGASPRQQVP